MSTVTTRKPRQKPQRFASWFEQLGPAIGDVGCIEFRFVHPANTRRTEPMIETEHYLITRLASDFGECFELEKIEFVNGDPVPSTESHYHTCLDGVASSCECRGFLKHNHCKHIESLLALQAEGKLYR